MFFIISSIIASNTNASEDQISNLILKVNAKSSNYVEMDLIENKLLGRASWKIKCQYKVFEDMKACVMSKGPISILHVNYQYIVNIGEKHLKDNPVFIHVDNKGILQEREGLFRNGSELIKQFKSGNYAFTRFQNNKKQLIENKISLDGFTDAFNDMEDQFSKLGNDRNYSF
ncbi:hypothetical protein F4W09_16405 [Acinetobacter tandoii]|uniref:Uncharacterized protein n=2 Tax=Moraxellaceae TaxID=468 RepID=A0A5N4W889_9GAMM|nr:hypothetical protein F4W09_16405 [Acinetobacter tandoii]